MVDITSENQADGAAVLLPNHSPVSRPPSLPMYLILFPGLPEGECRWEALNYLEWRREKAIAQ